MIEAETFLKDGAWICSSRGFRVRALGIAGMEYVSGPLTLRLDTEALGSDAFTLDARELPDEVRDRVVDDVTRAWGWSGFEIRLVQPFDWDSVAIRPPWDRGRSFKDRPGWRFEVHQRSAGVYEGTSTRLDGASVRAVGVDPEAVVARLRQEAGDLPTP